MPSPDDPERPRRVSSGTIARVALLRRSVTSLPQSSSATVQRSAELVVSTALRLAPREKLVVFTDWGSAPIGGALGRAAFALEGEVAVAYLDESRRPMRTLPPELVEELQTASASAFVASAPPEELGMRQALLALVSEKRLRHAHMPGISQLAFTSGLRIDQTQLAKTGTRLLGKLAAAREVVSESALGTRLRVGLDGGRWFPQLGVLEPGRWGNLPAGALFTSTDDVDGTFWANASLGEFFGRREGLLTKSPVRFEIQRGRVRSVDAAHSKLLTREIETVLAAGEGSDRVGLVAIGVNYGITAATGEALVDQNLPGLHLAFGDPAGSVTGATWRATTSFAACQAESTVLVDGAVVVDRGRLASLA